MTGRYEADFATHLLRTYAPSVGILAALILGGRLLLRPLLRMAARAKSRELFIAASLFVVLVTGLVAQAGGVSWRARRRSTPRRQHRP